MSVTKSYPLVIANGATISNPTSRNPTMGGSYNFTLFNTSDVAMTILVGHDYDTPVGSMVPLVAIGGTAISVAAGRAQPIQVAARSLAVQAAAPVSGAKTAYLLAKSDAI